MTEMNRSVKAAFESLVTLNPIDLVEALRRVAGVYQADAQCVKKAWTNPNTGEIDPEAGSVWDIAADGLTDTADKIQKYWDSI